MILKFISETLTQGKQNQQPTKVSNLQRKDSEKKNSTPKLVDPSLQKINLVNYCKI